jgi:hypothetical protein
LSAASELREYTEQSNALHQAYLGDAGLLQRYERFVAWQLDYLLPFYEDLRGVPNYAAAVDFVVSDLTGIGISRRDHDIARVVPVMSRMLPERVLSTMASAMQLNARVLGINVAICRELYEERSAHADISEADYCIACRSAAELHECLELVQLTREIGHSLEHVVHIPMIGITLRAMRTPARVAGFGALQEFLEQGFTTFVALDNVDRFLDDITQRMTEVFTHIFTRPIAQLNPVPSRR